MGHGKKPPGVLFDQTRGPAENYQGQNLITKPGVKTIMVPTTAGTGSEVTGVAVLIHRQKNN